MLARTRFPGLRLAVLLLLTFAFSAFAAPASAAEGAISHVESANGELRVLYSIPDLGEGASPELGSVKATLDDQDVPAVAALAANSGKGVRRTTILAIDVSQSMRADGRFTEAKKAAEIFLETAPLDVRVGIVTFANQVEVVQEPTLDRQAAVEVLDDLSLSLQTHLYEGIQQAVRTAGSEGQRNVLVLSDGDDTSSTPIEDVTSAIKGADLQVDVISLGQSGDAVEALERIADAGKGSVLSTDDPAALSAAFAEEAAELAKQVLVTVEVPPGSGNSEGTLSVSIDASGQTYTDSAFVSLGTVEAAGAETKSGPIDAPAPKFAISTTLMLAGLAALGIGGLVVLAGALGLLSPRKTETLEERVAAYSLSGDARRSSRRAAGNFSQSQPAQDVTSQAVGMAERALAGNKSLEAALGSKLEAAGMSLKPAEWLLAHAGIAFAAGLLGFLLSGGGILLTLMFLFFGGVLPYVFLGLKKGRRLKAFNAHLADTLQLMAGSLSAGLSLAQSVDTVVREGTEPIAGEFRRSLVEARLGVEIEDSLDGVAERMESDDFRWVVMAVRIQRQVGGNLAELLLQVAATLREREYLRRQVSALSAEGRLSAWILGGLPPVFVAYLALAKPAYLAPMITSPLGWLMFGAMAVLLAVGIFWMSRMVKVEV